MAQPKEAPISVRLGPVRRAAIVAYAAAKKITPHAAMLELLDIGLGAPPQTIVRTGSAMARTAELAVKPRIHVELPVYERKEFNPQQKTGKKR